MIEIRPATPKDLDFLFSSWLHSFRSCWINQEIPKDRYYRSFHNLIARILEKARVTIACESSDPELIVGYIVWEEGKVYWIYVKEDFRKLGIASQLLDGKKGWKVRFSSWRMMNGKIYDPARRLKHKFELEYDPYGG